MRAVFGELRQAILNQQVRYPLHRLAGDPQPSRDLRHSRVVNRGRAEDLPSRLRLADFAGDGFSPIAKGSRQVEHIGDNLRNPIRVRRFPGIILGHLTTCCQNDNIMSNLLTTYCHFDNMLSIISIEETMKRQILEDCDRLAFEGKMSFPESLQRMAATGVERYRADLVCKEKMHYAADGEAIAVSMSLKNTPLIAEQFDTDGIKSALTAIQSGKIKYDEFLRRIMLAGVSDYSVWLKG